jgi:hypothetical protein
MMRGKRTKVTIASGLCGHCNPLYLKGIVGHGGAERINFKEVLVNDLVL